MEDPSRDEGDRPAPNDWRTEDYAWDSRRLVALRLGADAATGGASGEDGAQDEDTRDPMEGDAQPDSQAAPRERCMVKDCPVDLTHCKAYYRRFRICERHLKTLSLCIEGKPSRFCQQCGRFHGLEEFEGSKRSCRRALLTRFYKRRNMPVPLDVLPAAADSGPRQGAKDTDSKLKAKPRTSPGSEPSQIRRKRGRPRAPPIDVWDLSTDDPGAPPAQQQQQQDEQPVKMEMEQDNGRGASGGAQPTRHLLQLHQQQQRYPGGPGGGGGGGGGKYGYTSRSGPLASCSPDTATGSGGGGGGSSSNSSSGGLQPPHLRSRALLTAEPPDSYRHANHHHYQTHHYQPHNGDGSGGDPDPSPGHSGKLQQHHSYPQQHNTPQKQQQQQQPLLSAAQRPPAPRPLAGPMLSQQQQQQQQQQQFRQALLNQLELQHAQELEHAGRVAQRHLGPAATAAAASGGGGGGGSDGGEGLSRLQRHVLLLRQSSDADAAAMMGLTGAMGGGGGGVDGPDLVMSEAWQPRVASWAHYGGGGGGGGGSPGGGAAAIIARLYQLQSGGCVDPLDLELQSIANESLMTERDLPQPPPRSTLPAAAAAGAGASLLLGLNLGSTPPPPPPQQHHHHQLQHPVQQVRQYQALDTHRHNNNQNHSHTPALRLDLQEPRGGGGGGGGGGGYHNGGLAAGGGSGGQLQGVQGLMSRGDSGGDVLGLGRTAGGVIGLRNPPLVLPGGGGGGSSGLISGGLRGGGARGGSHSGSGSDMAPAAVNGSPSGGLADSLAAAAAAAAAEGAIMPDFGGGSSTDGPFARLSAPHLLHSQQQQQQQGGFLSLSRAQHHHPQLAAGAGAGAGVNAVAIRGLLAGAGPLRLPEDELQQTHQPHQQQQQRFGGLRALDLCSNGTGELQLYQQQQHRQQQQQQQQEQQERQSGLLLQYRVQQQQQQPHVLHLRDPPQQHHQHHHHHPQQQLQLGGGGGGGGGGRPSLKEAAQSLLAQGGPRAPYQSPCSLLERLNIKIYQRRPDELNPALAERLADLISHSDASMLQGSIRPGCTHLVLDLLVSEREQLTGGLLGAEGTDPRVAAEQIVWAVLGGQELGPDCRLTVQFGDWLLCVQDGQVRLRRRALAGSARSATASAGRGPPAAVHGLSGGSLGGIDPWVSQEVLGVAPLAVVAGLEFSLEVLGRGLHLPGTSFHLRFRGRHLDVMSELAEDEYGNSSSGGGSGAFALSGGVPPPPLPSSIPPWEDVAAGRHGLEGGAAAAAAGGPQPPTDARDVRRMLLPYCGTALARPPPSVCSTMSVISAPSSGDSGDGSAEVVEADGGATAADGGAAAAAAAAAAGGSSSGSGGSSGGGGGFAGELSAEQRVILEAIEVPYETEPFCDPRGVRRFASVGPRTGTPPAALTAAAPPVGLLCIGDEARGGALPATKPPALRVLSTVVPTMALQSYGGERWLRDSCSGAAAAEAAAVAAAAAAAAAVPEPEAADCECEWGSGEGLENGNAGLHPCHIIQGSCPEGVLLSGLGAGPMAVAMAMAGDPATAIAAGEGRHLTAGEGLRCTSTVAAAPSWSYDSAVASPPLGPAEGGLRDRARLAPAAAGRVLGSVSAALSMSHDDPWRRPTSVAASMIRVDGGRTGGSGGASGGFFSASSETYVSDIMGDGEDTDQPSSCSYSSSASACTAEPDVVVLFVEPAARAGLALLEAESPPMPLWRPAALGGSNGGGGAAAAAAAVAGGTLSEWWPVVVLPPTAAAAAAEINSLASDADVTWLRELLVDFGMVLEALDPDDGTEYGTAAAAAAHGHRADPAARAPARSDDPSPPEAEARAPSTSTSFVTWGSSSGTLPTYAHDATPSGVPGAAAAAAAAAGGAAVGGHGAAYPQRRAVGTAAAAATAMAPPSDCTAPPPWDIAPERLLAGLPPPPVDMAAAPVSAAVRTHSSLPAAALAAAAAVVAPPPPQGPAPPAAALQHADFGSAGEGSGAGFSEPPRPSAVQVECRSTGALAERAGGAGAGVIGGGVMDGLTAAQARTAPLSPPPPLPPPQPLSDPGPSRRILGDGGLQAAAAAYNSMFGGGAAATAAAAGRGGPVAEAAAATPAARPSRGLFPPGGGHRTSEPSDSSMSPALQPLGELTASEAARFFGFTASAEVTCEHALVADSPARCDAAGATAAAADAAAAAVAALGVVGGSECDGGSPSAQLLWPPLPPLPGAEADADEAAAAAAAAAARREAVVSTWRVRQRQELVPRARSLLVFFCNRGFPHCAALVLSFLLRAAGMEPSVADAVTSAATSDESEAAAHFTTFSSSSAPGPDAAAADDNPNPLPPAAEAPAAQLRQPPAAPTAHLNRLPLIFSLLSGVLRRETGMGLLHHSVRSGSSTMVGLVLRLSRVMGHPLDVLDPGPDGVTPAHLAALLPDSSALLVLEALVDHATRAATMQMYDSSAAAAVKTGAAADHTAALQPPPLPPPPLMLFRNGARGEMPPLPSLSPAMARDSGGGGGTVAMLGTELERILFRSGGVAKAGENGEAPDLAAGGEAAGVVLGAHGRVGAAAPPLGDEVVNAATAVTAATAAASGGGCGSRVQGPTCEHQHHHQQQQHQHQQQQQQQAAVQEEEEEGVRSALGSGFRGSDCSSPGETGPTSALAAAAALPPPRVRVLGAAAPRAGVHGLTAAVAALAAAALGSSCGSLTLLVLAAVVTWCVAQLSMPLRPRGARPAPAGTRAAAAGSVMGLGAGQDHADAAAIAAAAAVAADAEAHDAVGSPR